MNFYCSCCCVGSSSSGALATYKFSSICRGIGKISVPNSCSILCTANRSSCVIKLMARPKWPKRPDRPIRWLKKTEESNCCFRALTFSLQIGFAETWKIEVDDNVDSLNVDTTSEEIGANEISAKARSEIVKNTISMFLSHFRVNIITIVA